jgi:RNA polymerase sigma factor (TIGR02999 family)
MDRSVAALIENAEQGDGTASSALFALLYTELHRLARAQLARSANPRAIGTTTLLHEAYLELAGREAVFPDRARFMAYAARAMRGLILNHARARRTGKRGGDVEMTPLDEAVAAAVDGSDPDLERIGAALDELSAIEPRLAQVVDLRFFCGFTFVEIAEMWGQSERTVQRQWEKARIYLHAAIGGTLPA